MLSSETNVAVVKDNIGKVGRNNEDEINQSLELTNLLVKPTEDKQTKNPYPRMVCEYCKTEVGMNVYIRSHGDNCAYKDVKLGYKKCKKCGKEKPLSEFSVSSASTFDRLNQSCKACASIKLIICPYCKEKIQTRYVNHRFTVEKTKTKT